MVKLITIIVTGSPGVGKSTVSKKLALKLLAKHLDVSKNVEEFDVIDRFDEERETAIVNLIKLSKVLIEKIESSEIDVIIDGHLAPHVIPDRLVNLAIILRRNPQQVEKELKKRGYSDNKVKENVRCEILDVCLLDCISKYGKEKCHEIDTTDKDLNFIVDELEKVIKGLVMKRVGIIDWLELINKENKLNYYFE
jgi:adenylate kinase